MWRRDQRKQIICVVLELFRNKIDGVTVLRMLSRLSLYLWGTIIVCFYVLAVIHYKLDTISTDQKTSISTSVRWSWMIK